MSARHAMHDPRNVKERSSHVAFAPHGHENAGHLSPCHRLDFLRNLLSAEFASDPNRLLEIECTFRDWENVDHSAIAFSFEDVDGHGPPKRHRPWKEKGEEEAGAGAEGFVQADREVEVIEESDDDDEEEEIMKSTGIRAMKFEGWGKMLRRCVLGNRSCSVIRATALAILGLFLTLYHHLMGSGGRFLHLSPPT
ncbi:hypothetical protein CRG98_025022 [Punica granatum]|uniref:Uncharacterized protein n=1 Tax=Punica granatum TaxID=22663 RepID=A0A2I0JE32_PUNGR|nr:hypothetical protein CRG98_025022 [Punica granatum]